VGTHHSRELAELARELGVSDRVHFLGQRRDIASVLAATDVYAMPSYGEPFGLVYAEAMAMKRPVVALDEGGAPEVVEHGKTGLLSSSGDMRALVQNLRTLLSDQTLRARMGEHGRKVVERRFHPERMGRDVGCREHLRFSMSSRSPANDRHQ
jgi:glycosyltransferase involved in cell wall biosynthesis